MKLLFSIIGLFIGLFILSLCIFFVSLHIKFVSATIKNRTVGGNSRYIDFIRSKLRPKKVLAVLFLIPLCLSIVIIFIFNYIITPYPSEKLESIAIEANLFLIRTGGLCHRIPEAEKELYKTDDRKEIKHFLELLSFNPSPIGTHCQCCGDLTFEFYKNNQINYAFSLHHDTHIRIQGQSTGDIYLTSDSIKSLNAWLVEKGIREQLKSQ